MLFRSIKALGHVHQEASDKLVRVKPIVFRRPGELPPDPVSKRVTTAVEVAVTLEEIGNLALKGLSQAVGV